MDATKVRSMLLAHFEFAGSDPDRAHAHYHLDAVLEFPQSGERFEGLDNIRDWRADYPANTEQTIRRVRGAEDLWVAELTVTYDGGPEQYGVGIMEFRGDKIARETIYVAEGWDAPEWRAKWRAAP